MNTSEILNRFKCDYEHCGRILKTNKTKLFHCSSCGHGTMRLTEPKAFCKCGKPIYANVTPPDKKTAFCEKGKVVCYDYVDITCDTCTQVMLSKIQSLGEELHTDFADTEDMEEKLAYYETEKKKIEELDIPIAKEPPDVKVRSLGDRLRIVRKKLQWNQKELAEYLGIKSKSTVARYENNERKIPRDIKEWIKRIEVMFDHQSKEQVRKLVKASTDFRFMRKSPREKLPKEERLGGMYG